MQLKRFFAKDNHSVLKLVREQLGADAIIISNRKVDDGVEVIASASYDEAEIQRIVQGDAEFSVATTPVSTPAPAVRPASASAIPKSPTKQSTKPPARPAVKTADQESPSFAETLSEAKESSSITDMREELKQLRSLLDGQIAASRVGQWGQQSKARAELFDKLARIGLGVEQITSLIADTDISDDLEQASRKVLIKLRDSIRISEHDAIEQGGIVVLHGPTGAGKTTTIAKLAARFLRNHESREIVLVCADNARVGAYEQLQTFGKLLGISVVRVRHANEFFTMLGVLADKKLVLLDSAGMGQADLRNPQKLFGMDAQTDNIRHYLVIPATMQRSAMERILDSMAKSGLSGLILTKLDDAVQLGDVLTSLVTHDIPLTSWTDGQSIPNDIHRADAAVLVARAMRLNKTPGESKDDRILLSMLQNTDKPSELWH